jgi:type IV pilus assembly protein PilA
MKHTKNKMKTNQKGFSLIELLIVVVSIGIIAAIAIPNLLASRRAANEAAAISTMRTIVSAETTCHATAAAGVANAYCDSAALAGSNLLDSSFSVSPTTRTGYDFTITALTPATSGFDAIAVPVTIGTTGTRSFAVAERGVIYTKTDGSVPVFAADRTITGGLPIQ